MIIKIMKKILMIKVLIKFKGKIVIIIIIIKKIIIKIVI